MCDKYLMGFTILQISSPTVTPSGPGKSVTVARVSLWPHMISCEGREKREWKRGWERSLPMTRCRATFNYSLNRVNICPLVSSIDMIFNARAIYVLKYLLEYSPDLRSMVQSCLFLFNKLKILADDSKIASMFGWWHQYNQHIGGKSVTVAKY